MMRLDLATAEYIGARAQQQDTAAAMQIEAGAMLVLADGLGGHESGADASRIVVDTFRDAGNKGRFDKAETRRQALRDALERANSEIGQGVDPAHGHRGMASTVVAAVVAHGELSWVSVGDSHLYVWRKGRLAKLNEDHSQAGIMVRSGQYKPGDPELQAVKSVLVSALTGRKLDIVDLPQTTFKIEVDDVLILASDGLNTLDDNEIERIVTEVRPQGAVRLSTVLLETVRSRRAPRQDNTTVAVARVLALPARPDVAQNGHGRIGTAAQEVSVPLLLENEARTERIVPAPHPDVEEPTAADLQSPTEPEAVVTAPPPLPEPPTAQVAAKPVSEGRAPAGMAMSPGEKAGAADEKSVSGEAPTDASTPPHGRAGASGSGAGAGTAPQVAAAAHAERAEATAAAQPPPTANQRPVAAKLPSPRGSGAAPPPLRADASGGGQGTSAASINRAAATPPPPVSPRPQPPQADDGFATPAKRSTLGRTLGALLLIVLLAGSIAAGAVAYLRPEWLQGLLPGATGVERPASPGIAPPAPAASPTPAPSPGGEPASTKPPQPAGVTVPAASTGVPEPAKVEPPQNTAPVAADPPPAREGVAGEERSRPPVAGSGPPTQGATPPGTETGPGSTADPTPQVKSPAANGSKAAAPAASGSGEPKLVEEPRPVPAPSPQSAPGTQSTPSGRPPRTPPPKQ